MPRETVADEKRIGPRRVEISRSYWGTRSSWLPWWMTMMSRASWKRAAAQRRDGIINYYQANSFRRAWPRTNERRAREGACLCACVRACTDARATGYELAQLQLAKSSEPFITLVPTLILNRRHELPGAAQKTRPLFVSPSQKIYEQSAFACNAADTPDHSESFRHASRVTRFVPTRLFFTFSPIESCYNTARYRCEMSRHYKSFSL